MCRRHPCYIHDGARRCRSRSQQEIQKTIKPAGVYRGPNTGAGRPIPGKLVPVPSVTR